MERRLLILSPLLSLASPWAHAGLSEGDAVAGIRAALERGCAAAVDRLGRSDGFLANPAVRIELPGHLKDAARLLKGLGQGRKVDELLTTMNRAAEAAVPAARPLLLAAVKAISVEDGLQLLRGGEDALTQFFAGKTRQPLGEKFLPIVRQMTDKLALADKYQAVAGKAVGLGLLRAEDADINRYVSGRAIDGLFQIIAEEERKLRQDPLGSGSALLKKVFGGLN